MSHYDNYKDYAVDLTIDLKAARGRIAELESELNEVKRELALSELHVQAVKRDKSAVEFRWRQDVERLRSVVIPLGDLEHGYECECGTDIDYPLEQNYCSDCGVQFDWRSRPLDDDDWAYDRLRDERLEQDDFSKSI